MADTVEKEDKRFKKLSDKIDKKVKSTQFYEDFKSFIKFIGKIVVGLIFLYGAIKLFGWWIVYSAIISLFFFIPFYIFVIKIRGKQFLMVDVDKRELKRVFIPYKKYNKEFKKEKRFSPFSDVEVIKNIDLENKKIEGFWFTDKSDLDFLIDYKTFNRLSEEFREYIEKFAPMLKKYDVLALYHSAKNIKEINDYITNMPKEEEIKTLGGELNE